jgi:hypothetical protein
MDILLLCGGVRRGRDDQGDLAPRDGFLSPLTQRVQRAGAHVLMNFRQLAQNHGTSVAKSLRQLLQCEPQAPRGFEYDEREASRRGTANQPQTLSSHSGQESKRQKGTVDQS